MEDLQDIIKEFLIESHENVDQLDRDLVTLEQDPTCEPTLSSIFRTVHTIKGTCGFLGFGRLESVAHAGESLLGKLRDGQLQLRAETTTGLLSLVDAIREMLANIEHVGAEGEKDYSTLIETLIRLQHETLYGGPATTAPSTMDENTTQGTGRSRAAFQSGTETAGNEVSAADAQQGVCESTIRVDVGLLDKLMNRVGELVLTRNQFVQSSGMFSDSVLLGTAQRLNLITTELQEAVMKTRMQPISNVWVKFPRIVRDLAVQCGKQVRIEMEGRETELDKTVIEAIKDPLVHLVRNAIDHGIETSETRRANGKPAEGRLVLRAFHEGGQVNIEITDDGAGLNIERIRQKAIEAGLISQDKAQRMSDHEVTQFIFVPGFSTAAKVSHLSGRGVGMDVVKTNIERIGGTVDIQTESGRRTTIKIKIPLTLAIIPALIVTCDGDRFAIPQVNLLELVRLEGDQARKGIERLHDVSVYRLRGQLLPIVNLREELGLERACAMTPVAATDEEVVNIVVLQAGDRHFGLVVDSVNDTEEIVVKPLSKQLKDLPMYAGATIMGDGRVALILDVLGTAQRAHVVSEVQDRALKEPSAQRATNGQDRQTLLITVVGNRRLAMSVSQISRLEEVPRGDVEWANGHEVIQYRDRIMPLLHVGRALGIPTKDNLELPLQVVVHSDRGRSVGLVVDRIVDITESTIEATRPAQDDDVLASAVIQRRVTDLLDVRSFIRRVDPLFYESPLETNVA